MSILDDTSTYRCKTLRLYHSHLLCNRRFKLRLFSISPTMSSFTAPGQFSTTTSTVGSSLRTLSESTTTATSHSVTPPAIRCNLSATRSPNYEALISSMSKINSVLVNSITAAYGLLVRFGSGSGSGFGGGGGGDGGSWWRFLSYAKGEGKKGREWDAHGLPADILVQLSKLSAFKKYKISEILFFDRLRSATAGTEDSFFEMVSLRAGGVYTKVRLQKELETLATWGMFEEVVMEGKTNPDGTIGLTISLLESTWLSAKRFRCINVGLMQQMKRVDMDQQMTDKEMIEAFKNQEKDYKRRIESSRPCLFPASISKKVMKMLKAEGKVSARSLQKIRDRVQKWYHDEGYACAQVVCFENLNMKEIVCEVVEGDITQLVIQFQDKLGNVVKGNTNLDVVCRELPKQLRQGHVFNIEAGKQALRNINSLALFSNIELIPKPDGKNEGGIIVEIKLKELEQKTDELD